MFVKPPADIAQDLRVFGFVVDFVVKAIVDLEGLIFRADQAMQHMCAIRIDNRVRASVNDENIQEIG